MLKCLAKHFENVLKMFLCLLGMCQYQEYVENTKQNALNASGYGQRKFDLLWY